MVTSLHDPLICNPKIRDTVVNVYAILNRQVYRFNFKVFCYINEIERNEQRFIKLKKKRKYFIIFKIVG